MTISTDRRTYAIEPGERPKPQRGVLERAIGGGKSIYLSSLVGQSLNIFARFEKKVRTSERTSGRTSRQIVAPVYRRAGGQVAGGGGMPQQGEPPRAKNSKKRDSGL